MVGCGLRRPRAPALALLAALAAIPFSEAAAPKAPNLGLGYEYDLSAVREEFLLPDPIVDASIAPDHPLYVRIRAPWSLLEPAPGAYDWSEVDRIVSPYRAANFVTSLCLYGTNRAIDPAGRTPSAANAEVMRDWLALARAAALHFKGQVAYYEVWDEPNRTPEFSLEHVSEFAYLLKNTSVTIRSADPEARIVQGSLALGAGSQEADLAWQDALYDQGVATYVDVLAIHPAPDAPIAGVVARAYDHLLEHDPSAQLWVIGLTLRGETDRDRAADLLKTFLAGQGEGAAVVTYDLEADVDGQPELPGVLLDLHKLFIPTYRRLPGGTLAFEAFQEGPGVRLPGVTAYRFFDAEAFQGLVGFYAEAPPPEGKATMVLDTASVQGVVIYDIVGGTAGAIRNVRPDFKTNTTRVPVFVYERPQVLQYARVPIKGFEAGKEELEVKESGLITAEEVIAGHQTFMTDQRFRLSHYRADALLTYHGKIGGSNSVDVSIDNAFFWDKSTGAEWQQRGLYYNGVRW